MDQRVRYKIEDQKFNRRAAMLSRLDDAAEQKREIGICCAALEETVNARDWPMIERLTKVLIALRESQQQARERAGELVDKDEFVRTILEPLLNTIMQRIQEAVPDGWEDVINQIANDISRIDPQLESKL